MVSNGFASEMIFWRRRDKEEGTQRIPLNWMCVVVVVVVGWGGVGLYNASEGGGAVLSRTLQKGV